MNKYKITVISKKDNSILDIFFAKEDQSVFEALRQSSSKVITKGCFGGGCGVCKMEVSSGEYHQFKKMSKAHITDDIEDKNHVLLCCIIAKSDLILKIFIN